MEPNSPKKIQFAVPLFQSQIDPEAAEQIRKRRPTPASLVIMNEHMPPERIHAFQLSVTSPELCCDASGAVSVFSAAANNTARQNKLSSRKDLLSKRQCLLIDRTDTVDSKQAVIVKRCAFKPLKCCCWCVTQALMSAAYPIGARGSFQRNHSKLFPQNPFYVWSFKARIKPYRAESNRKATKSGRNATPRQEAEKKGREENKHLTGRVVLCT
ncbi:hypothetical protein EK904_002529 [Melospiza melodia maxima]|nr:hypothetical protein EK904_002529 [Melospiza melodia maxima]